MPDTEPDTMKLAPRNLRYAAIILPMLIASERGLSAKELGYRLGRSPDTAGAALRYLERTGKAAKCGGGCRTAWIDAARGEWLRSLLYRELVEKTAKDERRSLAAAERRIKSNRLFNRQQHARRRGLDVAA